MQSMANLFSAVFILLAVLSMYTTMTRLVKTQVTQIGTLKAIGFSDWSIRLRRPGRSQVPVSLCIGERPRCSKHGTSACIRPPESSAKADRINNLQFLFN